jgi:hypothetical protein
MDADNGHLPLPERRDCRCISAAHSSPSTASSPNRNVSKRLLFGLLLAATIWGLVDVRRRGYPTEDHKTDLTVYTEAGAAFFDGRPPYEVRNPRGWTYVYPPILAIVLAPLHALPMQDQSTVWFFVCLWMCWGAYRECARIVALIFGPNEDRDAGLRYWIPWFGAIAAATVTLPTLNCLQRGQVSIVVLYLLLLGLRLILSGRTYLTLLVGGIVLALPVAIKVVPILPIAFLLFVQMAGYLYRQWKWPASAAPLGRQFSGSTVGVGFGLALSFFLLPAALIGWNANLRHLNTWSHLVLSSAGDSTATPGFDKDTHSVRNQCLGNALYRLGNFGAYVFAGGPEDPVVDDDNPPRRMMDAPIVNTCLTVVRLTLLAAMLLVGIRLGMSKDERLSQATAFGLACAALLVVSPVARNHYFALLAPAVLFVPLWLDNLGRRLAAIVMATVPGVLIVLQYVFLYPVGRVGLLGLGTAGWLMAAMVLIDRTSRHTTSVTVGQDTAEPRLPAALPEAA